MPTITNYSTGTHQYTIPADAYNVTFSIAAAGGGGSKPTNNNWSHDNGGGGRAGNFSIATRSYEYTLTVYIGGEGGTGRNDRGGGLGSGGSGGFSPVAGGGDGHRSGGGGGGASAVYDGGTNRYIAWCGGGGGAGRYGKDTGTNFGSQGAGIGGGRYSQRGAPSWRTGGDAPRGHRGGGGGGSVSGVFGGSGGATTSGGHAGIGGNSGWYDEGDIGWVTDSGYSNHGNGWFILAYEYPPPEIIYFHFRQNGATSTTITMVEGETVDIEYSVNGDRNMSSITLTDFGSISTSTTSNEFTVSPVADSAGNNIGTKTYTLTVVGAGGTRASSITATIYKPPTVVLTSDAPDNTITRGQQVRLTWVVDGYASTAQLSPNLGLQNISGNITLSPTETTLYTIAVGGLAGTDSDELTITVNQPPTVSLLAPVTTDYGNDIVLEYDYTNSEEGAILEMSKDGGGYVQIADENLLGGGDVAGDFIVTADQLYDDFGARTVQFRLTVYGTGSLQGEDFAETTINIDEMPDQITIPASEDRFIDEEPVITPDVEVTTDQLVINDIDIPVEIKSDTPIQVEIDDDGIWRNIREI